MDTVLDAVWLVLSEVILIRKEPEPFQFAAGMMLNEFRNWLTSAICPSTTIEGDVTMPLVSERLAPPVKMETVALNKLLAGGVSVTVNRPLRE
jgi:hypothetical protein